MWVEASRIGVFTDNYFMAQQTYRLIFATAIQLIVYLIEKTKTIKLKSRIQSPAFFTKSKYRTIDPREPSGTASPTKHSRSKLNAIVIVAGHSGRTSRRELASQKSFGQPHARKRRKQGVINSFQLSDGCCYCMRLYDSCYGLDFVYESPSPPMSY